MLARRRLLALTLLGGGLVSCGDDGDSANAGSGGKPTARSGSLLVGPARFAAAIAEPGRVLVNVHTPPEGRIEGTDLAIPYDQLAARAGELPGDRGTPLAVYCRSGRMSAEAVPTLVRLGFRDIVELRGGMEAWVASGRSLLDVPAG